MKVIFIRHGESVDEIKNEFSGWTNRPLTERGIKLGQLITDELNKNITDITKVYSSPLNRAMSFAKIIGDKLNLQVEPLLYLMDRNSTGILNGSSYDEIKAKYPEMLKRFENQEYVPGSERYEDFIERIQFLIDFLSNIEIEGTVLCVTHGYVISTLLEEYLGKKRGEIKYGSFIVCNIKNKDITLVDSWGISLIE